MRDTSFVFAPIRDHAFFKQAVLKGQVGNAFLQRAGLAAQVLHLAAGRSTGSVARQAALARFYELLRPHIIQALGDAFLAAQLGNAVIAAQAVEHDPDLVFSREMPPGLPPDVLHHPLSRGLYRRFFQGGLGLHLRSFVTTTKPQSSLNHNLKSVPLVLTGNNTYLDVKEIEHGQMTLVPEPKHNPVPEEWRSLSDGIGKSGTLVVWSELDIHRLTWKSAKATLQNTERLAGRIYRRFIINGDIRIRMLAKEENGCNFYEDDAKFDDPLYLAASSLVPAPFDQTPMFELVLEDDTHDIEYEGCNHKVTVRYSVAKKETVDAAGGQDRGRMPYGQHAARNIGVSVIRANRELMLDQGWCIGYDPRERWWGAEVEFPPNLDEIFGVTNNKQAATHFAELATLDWSQLKEDDEEFIDVVKRLKEEGDPRGWLLPLADSIKRTLQDLREIVKGQASGSRSTRKTRHDKPDDLTDAVNKSWKDRSKERPIDGEDQPVTDEALQDVKKDLTENKNYTEDEADELINLVKDADLKVVFLEADFDTKYQMFSVDIKGSGLTEVVFNRRHPGFDDIFGTVNTVDEDVANLSKEEVLARLTRAVNSSKIIFAAWARYEREAGMDRAKKLEKVRFDWGQLAAKFLDPEDDLNL